MTNDSDLFPAKLSLFVLVEGSLEEFAGVFVGIELSGFFHPFVPYHKTPLGFLTVLVRVWAAFKGIELFEPDKGELCSGIVAL